MTQQPARPRRWVLRHSAWLLAPILGFGLLSFVGFVYLAVRVRTARYWIAAVVSSAACALAWWATDRTEPGPTPGSTQTSSTGAAIALFVWVGLIAYAFVLNSHYLRWHEGRARFAPATVGTAPSPPLSVRPASADPVDEVRRRLDLLVGQVRSRGELPPDVVRAVERIDARLRELLSRAPQLASSPEQLHLVGKIVTDYLPTSLNAYAVLPRDFAMTNRTTRGRTHHEELLHQLGLLETRVAEMSTAAHAGDAALLEAQGRFLEDRFRRSELDLS